MKLLIVLLLVFQASAFSQVSACDYDSSECAAYCELSEKLQCQPGNYLMNFGYKFCHRYLDNAERFTQRGQNILAKIRSCLVLTLKEQEGLTCYNASDIAFESHYNCYVDNGFCELNHHDRVNLLWIARSQFFTKNFAAYGHRINEECRRQAGK